MIIILLISIIVMMFIYTLKREYLSPSFLVALSFAFASIGCIMFKKEWELNFSNKTILLICLGIICCYIGEMLIYFLTRKGKNRIKLYINIKPIIIENYKLIIFIFLQLITLVLYYHEVKSIAGSSESFSIMMSKYKDAIYMNTSLEGNVNILVKQFAKVSYIGTMIFIFVFLNNTISKSKIKNNVKYLIPSIIFIGQSIISSSRSLILQIAVAGIVYYYILYQMESNWTKKLDYKVIQKIILFALMILLSFWGIKEIVGRLTHNKSFIEYIAYYFSGGMAFFQKYIENPFGNFENIIGAETFPGILGFLSKFISDLNIVGNLEFRHSGSIHGNTYTAFRAYYHDFGILGVILLEGIFAIVYSVWINKIKVITINRKKNYQRSIIIFGCFAYPLVYEPIAAQLYRTVLSVNGLTYLVIIYGLYWFLFKLRLKLR